MFLQDCDIETTQQMRHPKAYYFKDFKDFKTSDFKLEDENDMKTALY